MEGLRASLASDLMEEFRAPLADRFTLKLFNNRIFTLEDFYSNPSNSAVYLKHESLKRYFKEYEDMMSCDFTNSTLKESTTFRKCFRLQAEKLSKSIQKGDLYIPFTYEI